MKLILYSADPSSELPLDFADGGIMGSRLHGISPVGVKAG